MITWLLKVQFMKEEMWGLAIVAFGIVWGFKVSIIVPIAIVICQNVWMFKYQNAAWLSMNDVKWKPGRFPWFSKQVLTLLRIVILCSVRKIVDYLLCHPCALFIAIATDTSISLME